MESFPISLGAKRCFRARTPYSLLEAVFGKLTKLTFDISSTVTHLFQRLQQLHGHNDRSQSHPRNWGSGNDMSRLDFDYGPGSIARSRNISKLRQHRTDSRKILWRGNWRMVSADSRMAMVSLLTAVTMIC